MTSGPFLVFGLGVAAGVAVGAGLDDLGAVSSSRSVSPCSISRRPAPLTQAWSLAWSSVRIGPEIVRSCGDGDGRLVRRALGLDPRAILALVLEVDDLAREVRPLRLALGRVLVDLDVAGEAGLLDLALVRARLLEDQGPDVVGDRDHRRLGRAGAGSGLRRPSAPRRLGGSAWAVNSGRSMIGTFEATSGALASASADRGGASTKSVLK